MVEALLYACAVAQEATPTTCPVPSPLPSDDKVEDPVCSLCPDGMILDTAMKDVAPLQEYAAEIAKALAQAGQSEFIPVVLSFVTCGCEALEHAFASVTFNSFLSRVEGVDEQCSLLQQFLGSGGFPGGPEGCCKNPNEGTGTSSGTRSTFGVKNNEGSFGWILSLSRRMLAVFTFGTLPIALLFG